MRIKTITCHDVYNFGASLQAYALQQFLIGRGHQVEIIDYLPTYKHFYEWLKICELGFIGKLGVKLPFFKPIFALIQHRKWLKELLKIYRFKSFKKNKLSCTKQSYKSIEELINNKPEADLYIAGSDQIWNTAFLNGLDPAYYCMFEKDKNKCISYAASFALTSIPSEHHEFVKKGLSNFRSISVREQSGVKIAKEFGFEATNVLDPVFLLSKEEWKKVIKKQHKGKYLLVYDFSNKDPRIDEIAQKIAMERGLDVYSFNSDKPYISKVLRNCGPIEFLEWINDADMVISNSFHATAFSTIFQRDFYTIPLLGYGNSSRMIDFLDMVDLSSRFINDIKQIEVSEHIDYDNVQPLLEAKRKESISWLLNNI